VLVRPGCDSEAHRRQLAGLLQERFGIEHTTLQVERVSGGDGPLQIEPLEPARDG
jgi:hypothetical protein